VCGLRWILSGWGAVKRRKRGDVLGYSLNGSVVGWFRRAARGWWEEWRGRVERKRLMAFGEFFSEG